MGTIDIEYAVKQEQLQALLESVDRPGSFCVHGRTHLPMPAVEVGGAGGELIVRHRKEEVRIDMSANEPSELAFAAFYADCAHESRPRA